MAVTSSDQHNLVLTPFIVADPDHKNGYTIESGTG